VALSRLTGFFCCYSFPVVFSIVALTGNFFFPKNHLKLLVFTLVLNEVIQVLEGVGGIIL
jgi:hypothetical protein